MSQVLQLSQRVVLQYEVEQLYYDEAAALDEGRFDDWLDFFTEDANYQVPVREDIQDNRSGIHEEQLAVFLIDDDKTFLRHRVARLKTGMAHVETPPSRTRHMVGNVRIAEPDNDSLSVQSNFVVYQGRIAATEATFYGRRTDVLRRQDGYLRIAHRTIVLDVRVLPRALSIFF